jgi:hypothetical protein
MQQAIEWRVGYEREGGREPRFKHFQTEASAKHFMSKLLMGGLDLRPLVWCQMFTREVGPWDARVPAIDRIKETA